MVWLAANWIWLAPLITIILSTVATGLSQYPQASGWVTAIRFLMDRLSLVSFKNSPGSLSLPGVASAPPVKVCVDNVCKE